MENRDFNFVIPAGTLDKVVVSSSAVDETRTLKQQLNDWLKTVLEKMDGVAQAAQSEVKRACTDLLQKQEHAFSEVNHLKIEVLGTVASRATDHENEIREVRQAMDSLASKTEMRAGMKNITDKIAEIMATLAQQADLLLEWQQPLTSALDRNQADLTSQLACLYSTQMQHFQKLSLQLDRQTEKADALEIQTGRNHQELKLELEKHAHLLSQLKEQCNQVELEQHRQLDTMLGRFEDQHVQLLTQLTAQAECLSTEQKQLSSDSHEQLTQRCDQIMFHLDPLKDLTKHYDRLLREQRQQFTPVLETLHHQNQELLTQLSTGLDSLSASHQQLSTDSLTQVQQVRDHLLHEQHQQFDNVIQLAQHCDQMLREQQQQLDQLGPLATVTQHCDQALEEQKQQLDQLLSTVQEQHQELPSQVASQVESQFQSLSSECKQLNTDSVADLKQNYDLLLQQLDSTFGTRHNENQELLSHLTVQLDNLFAEHKQLNIDSLDQLRQQYEQLREQQQQQQQHLDPLLSTIQDQRQELVKQLESLFDEQLDCLAEEQKQLSTDSQRKLTKQWDQLLKEQGQQLDRLFSKPQDRHQELLTQLKTSVERLSKEQAQLRTDMLTQPLQRPQREPVLNSFQDQLAGTSGQGQATTRPMGA
ncbi:unnamed protein product, partial [Symbiodinium pilosum]